MANGLISWLDTVAYPSGVLVLGLLLLFLAGRLSYLGRIRVGVVGLLAGAFVLLLSFLSPVLRPLLFDAYRLPVTLGLLLTPCVAWFTERSEGPETASRSSTETATASTFEVGEGWVAAAVLGAVLALAWGLEPPLGSAVSEAPLEPSKLPWFLSGWQEMRLVTRPLWNWLLWPLWVFALLAVPYLEPEVAPDDDATSRREATRLFLFFVVVLGWVPLTVGTFLRDGQWRLLGLFGTRDGAPMAVSLAESFWRRGLGMAPPELGLWRQLPGLLAICAYVALLCLALPRWRASRGLFRRYRKQLGAGRYRLALALLTVLGWVPLKLLLYWLLSIDDWVVLPFWPGGL